MNTGAVWVVLLVGGTGATSVHLWWQVTRPATEQLVGLVDSRPRPDAKVIGRGTCRVLQFVASAAAEPEIDDLLRPIHPLLRGPRFSRWNRFTPVEPEPIPLGSGRLKIVNHDSPKRYEEVPGRPILVAIPGHDDRFGWLTCEPLAKPPIVPLSSFKETAF